MEPESVVEVLVVGGGPVGLATALELGRRGIRTLLVEARDGSVTVPKMNLVNTRSMEFCRRWGVAPAVRAKGWPAELPMDVLFATSLAGWELARFCYPSYAERGIPEFTPEGSWRCAQLYFDPILLERLRREPSVAIRHRTRMEEFSQDGGAVIARLADRDSGRETRVRAAYMIACDGADGSVLRTLGITSSGVGRLSSHVNLFFESPDVVSAHTKGHAWLTWLFGPEGQWGGMVHVNGAELWRMSYPARPEDPPMDDAYAMRMLHRAVGAPVQARIRAKMPWIRTERLANAYRAGRVFLAGDAVHVMSPTGGLGMNTGLADAIDLAWKLSAVLRGWGGESLLDTYEAERRPVALANIEEAGQNFRKLKAVPTGPEIADDTPAGARLRARIAETIYTGGYRVEYEQDATVLGYCYEGSPIIVPDGSAAPRRDGSTYNQTGRPGHRAPHVWLAPERSTLDLFDHGFALLRFGRPRGEEVLAAAASAGLPVTAHDIESAQARDLYGRDLVLVRPDGHVAWRGDADPDQPERLIDTVRGGPVHAALRRAG